jgi:hypothetical protein
MIEYPKIETLYDRDPKTHKVDTAKVRLPEFLMIKEWVCTEKVDGTNIRIGLQDGKVSIGGRTDNAQIPANLAEYLYATFTLEKMMDSFPYENKDSAAGITLFGEGYGEKIQNGGGLYRSGVSFRLFDVRVGNWWLERDSLESVAERLGIKTVPYVEVANFLPSNTTGLNLIIGTPGLSVVCREENPSNPPTKRAEGIVARTSPLLLRRNGERLMWKLKYSDFPEV